ncbi:hypothetical protein P43SY_000898 [Pythium insidiosum]|uniref:Uncharacterized protein n=1 Tax=Pythium insidiosum TaxID=114742 RepID=A0AAD5LFU3_PYTIN|nr:hypothetical protein P43SY_000898 [Pythium insidiosum]
MQERRSSLRRSFSQASTALAQSPMGGPRRTSLLAAPPALSSPAPMLKHSNSGSNNSKRRVVRPAPSPLVRASSGTSTSRKQLSFKSAHPSGSRYSNRSYVDGRSKREKDRDYEDMDDTDRRERGSVEQSAPDPTRGGGATDAATEDSGSPSKAKAQQLSVVNQVRLVSLVASAGARKLAPRPVGL